ncbi:MAG: CRISPR-associated helicase Cas3' [Candidatus Methanomethylophilaceae archaeon]|nr:CRISPR-associated helicase Cas3' [Candidatus Methanomethylophilaceae archaeon]
MAGMVAHIRNDGTMQDLENHLIAVGKIAENNCNKVGLDDVGFLLGLLHDLGKATDEFQSYIMGRSVASRGEIDHSTAGAQYLNEISGYGSDLSKQLSVQIMALGIMSHHSGLIDCIDGEGRDVYGGRIGKARSKTRIDEAMRSIGPGYKNLVDDCAMRALDSMESLVNKIIKCSKDKKDRGLFALGLLSRFVLSCLIDADHRDTSEFEYGKKEPKSADWGRLSDLLESKLESFDRQDSISEIRSKISDSCFMASSRARGIYTLSVPTGGGKTLSSLRFALNHAKSHGMDRIIYVIPYTSIIEQNAKVIRDVLSDDGSIVCEYHSNVDLGNDDDSSNLRYDPWDAPIIVTTMVQFLDTLFNSGTRRTRRMQSLARATLIFDEIQTLPVKTVYMFNEAINFLTRWCGSTAVMCTATQPLLGEIDHYPLATTDNSEIVDDIAGLEESLRRVVPEVKRGKYDAGAISQLVEELIENYESILVVTNTKSMAADVYGNVVGSIPPAVSSYHLSANMCPAHRSDTIAQMKKVLGKGKVVCVSTQLIEAGVDVDFNVVIRCMAGIDSIVQSAGRCNRNNKMQGLGRLFVVETDENVSHLKDIEVGRRCTRSVIEEFDDILSPESVSRYYRYYFFNRSEDMRYPTGNPDRPLFQMLSVNSEAAKMFVGRYGAKPKLLRQSFSEANRCFEVIEGVRGVIVSYNDESKEIISSLCSENPGEDSRQLMRKAQRYTVNTYRFDELMRSGAIKEVAEATGIYYLVDGFYDDHYGLREDSRMETMIMRGKP